MNVRSCLLLVVGAAVLAGCRTNKDILNDYERDLVSGDYRHAALEVSEKAKESGVDQLLWQLQAGGAQHLASERSAAIGYFDKAEDIFIRNDNQSVFSQAAAGAGAMMTNDRVFPFAGSGQDRIFTCLYKALDYAADNNVAAARTELNRAAQHQENWIYERRRDISAAHDRLQKEAKDYAKNNKAEVKDSDSSVDKAFKNASFAAQVKAKTGFDPRVDGDLDRLSLSDYLNVYVQHVCGVYRWLADGRGTEYLKSLPPMRANNAMLAADARDVSSEKPKDQVWVYVEDGLCPCREEWRLDLPLVLIPYLNRYILYAGMALPYLRYRNHACIGYSVRSASGSHQLELLQDMDGLLKVEHDVYMRGALAREITRTIAKACVQVALGVTADNCRDSYTQIALKSSQWAAAAWAASVTQADLRSWTSLPKAVYACRVTRPADGKLVLQGGGADQVVLDLPKGNSMVFVNKPSSLAKASVRLVTFAN